MNLGDLSSHRLIIAKGFLFGLMAMIALGLLIAERPDFRSAFLLGITVWASCRFYYFAFYVIEHYVDPGYRFAGLWDFAMYWVRNRRK